MAEIKPLSSIRDKWTPLKPLTLLPQDEEILPGIRCAVMDGLNVLSREHL
jgi:hypothetical protein